MKINIYDYRKKMKMSQEALAREAGLSRQTIWNIESGRQKDATYGTLMRLAKALGVKVDDLVS